jgi:hypothetical protein
MEKKNYYNGFGGPIRREGNMRRILFWAAFSAGTLACLISNSPAATPAATGGSAGETIAATPAAAETPDTATVRVYFTLAADESMTPVPVVREVPASDDPVEQVRSALDWLVRGPTDAEKAAGLTSWFSPATAGVVTAVGRDGGTFAVDFHSLDTLIPNASTSAGSQLLLSQLNSTVFQFAAVDSVRYTLDGDCGAFWQWLQMDCHTLSRAEWTGT